VVPISGLCAEIFPTLPGFGGGIAQSVLRLDTGWTVRGSNPSGARFFAHVQIGPGAHPTSYTVGTGSFQGVKRPGRGADHPPPSSAEVKKDYSYTSTPLWKFGSVRVTFTFTYQDLLPGPYSP
jgi:hypothetical protein